MKVLVWERAHPEDCIGPSDTVSCTGPQEELAVAVPSAASMAAELGLHPRLGFVPVIVPMGDDVFSTHVTVLEAEAMLPHASVAVHVLVCERLHPINCIAPSATVALTGLQLSLANADPSAASMSPELGLQPRLSVVPVVVIPGRTWSTIQVTVRAADAKLPQASVAIQVLVCERSHANEMTGPSELVKVTVPQSPVAFAVPNAASIAEVLGLQPASLVVPVVVITIANSLFIT